jgi:hypothetical protein
MFKDDGIEGDDGGMDFLGRLSPIGSEQDGGEGGRRDLVSKRGPKFSEKLIEEYLDPWQPSATPSHLQHRFMVSPVHVRDFKCRSSGGVPAFSFCT